MQETVVCPRFSPQVDRRSGFSPTAAANVGLKADLQDAVAELQALEALARELGMSVLVEVHDAAELDLDLLALFKA